MQDSTSSPLRSAPFLPSKNAYLTFNRGGPALWTQACGPSPWWRGSASPSAAISPFAEFRKKKDPLYIFATEQKSNTMLKRRPLALVSSRLPSRRELSIEEPSLRAATTTAITQSLQDVIMDLLTDSPADIESQSQPVCKSPFRPATPPPPSAARDVRGESTWRASSSASRPQDLPPPLATSLPDRSRAAAGYHLPGAEAPPSNPPPLQLCHPSSPTIWRPPPSAGSLAVASHRDLSVSDTPPSPHCPAAAQDGRGRPPPRWLACDPPPPPRGGTRPRAATAAAPGLAAAAAAGRPVRGAEVPDGSDSVGPGSGRPPRRVRAAADGPPPAEHEGGDGGLAPW
jgi:hypothetical protein